VDQFSSDTVAINTGLVFPGSIEAVPRPDEVKDSDYVPAETIDGLEEVGGLADWWENPDHWGSVQTYVGFARQEKILDPAVLEVFTKSALVEGLVLQRFKKRENKPAVATKGKETLLALAGVEVVAGPDGAATLKNEADYERVWSLLENAPSEATEAELPIATEEARELARSFGSSWKAVRIEDPVVKFHVSLNPLISCVFR
jgi:hypothetical protein